MNDHSEQCGPPATADEVIYPHIESALLTTVPEPRNESLLALDGTLKPCWTIHQHSFSRTNRFPIG